MNILTIKTPCALNTHFQIDEFAETVVRHTHALCQDFYSTHSSRPHTDFVLAFDVDKDQSRQNWLVSFAVNFSAQASLNSEARALSPLVVENALAKAVAQSSLNLTEVTLTPNGPSSINANIFLSPASLKQHRNQDVEEFLSYIDQSAKNFKSSP